MGGTMRAMLPDFRMDAQGNREETSLTGARPGMATTPWDPLPIVHM